MLQRRLLALALIAAALGATGCGSGVQYVPVDATVYESRPNDYPIFVHTQQVLKPHVVLGTLTVKRKLDAGYGGYSTYDIMVDMLKEEARKVGGDALINVRPLDSNKNIDTTVILTAQVVRYLEKRTSVTAQ